jgi:hypothetical protein
MSNIYLRHPVHGTKVANMEEEANADVANGWRVYNPIEQRVAPVAEVAEVAEVVEVAEVAETEEQPVEVKRRRRN